MDLQQEKNMIKSSEESAIFMYKSLSIEKKNISLKKYSTSICEYKTPTIYFSPKKGQVIEPEKISSWHHLEGKNFILKNSFIHQEHFYSIADLFPNRARMFKRIVDIVIAFIALFILSPIFIIVAYKVRKNLGSPIFFYQERPGKNGKLFKMIKFRSMKDIYDQDGQPLSDEQRITPFGQKLRLTSLDEMPQLINVLKGDMSIVGPRPMLKEFVELYSPEQARRLEVRPGMTGLAQVSGRNELDYEERFKCDVWYVNNHNLWVDFKIMFKTVTVMAKCEGINAPGHVGPSLFKGNIKEVE